MLQHLGWRSLEQRRRDARLTLLYKIITEEVVIPAKDKLIQPICKTRHMHSLPFQNPWSKIDTGKMSFFPRTIRDWNSLPDQVVTAGTLAAFKVAVSTID